MHWPELVNTGLGKVAYQKLFSKFLHFSMIRHKPNKVSILESDITNIHWFIKKEDVSIFYSSNVTSQF